MLGGLTLVSFGGPFVILGVVKGGESERWPPDRPVEWIVLGAVIALHLTLFFTCLTVGWWRRWVDPKSAPRYGNSSHLHGRTTST